MADLQPDVVRFSGVHFEQTLCSSVRRKAWNGNQADVAMATLQQFPLLVHGARPKMIDAYPGYYSPNVPRKNFQTGVGVRGLQPSAVLVRYGL